jgi:tetratricopeptide (TPR) repeat protein
MELRPTEPDPYFGAGLCLSAVGDAEGATTTFRQYVAMDARPDSRDFVEIARRNLAELERSLTAKANAMPKRASQTLIRAREDRDHGRVEEAIAAYRAAIAAGEKSAEAHAELGAQLVSARRAPEAVDVLRAAVRLDPSSATAWYHLAFALRESGQLESAVQAYRRYITFRPKDPDPHYGLGRALTDLGRTDEALVSFKLYTTMETRPTERQWVKKARAEIARLESAQRPHAPAPPSTPSKPSTTLTASPPAMAPRPGSAAPAQAPTPRQP